MRSLSLPTGGNFGFSGDGGSATQVARAQARAALLTLPDANQIVGAAQQTMNVALSSSQLLNPIIQGTGSGAITVPFTGVNSGLASQLKAVAKVIEQRATLGHAPGREVFFVGIGGFDTHSGEIAGHNSLFAQMSKAINAFYSATVNLGVADQVTTFTLSDFGRTMRANSAGTDHGWGGSPLHHRWQRLRPPAAWPATTCSASIPISRWGVRTTRAARGGGFRQPRWTRSAPRSSKWFGASPVDIAQIFPNIGKFATADVGFMR